MLEIDRFLYIRRMNAKPFLIGGLAFLLVRGFQKAKAAQQFVYDLVGLPSVRIDGTKITLTFNLLVTNKSSERFDVVKIFSRILVNGSYVGEVVSSQAFTIMGSGSSSIPLSVTLEASNTLLALVSAITGGSGSLVVRFEGYVQSSSVTIPISFDKKIR